MDVLGSQGWVSCGRFLVVGTVVLRPSETNCYAPCRVGAGREGSPNLVRRTAAVLVGRKGMTVRRVDGGIGRDQDEKEALPFACCWFWGKGQIFQQLRARREIQNGGAPSIA
eukprot:2197486-Pyramimonas_sp.AAC.1